MQLGFRHYIILVIFVAYRSIRVDLATYEKLATEAGKLQIRFGRRVSLSDALMWLVSKKNKSAREFWSKLKEKKAAGRAGRGKRPLWLGPTKPFPLVLHRREIS